MSEPLENSAPVEAQANPLLQPWQTPFETPPFAEIAPEHFLPAFEQAFADHAAEAAAITHDPATPDFAWAPRRNGPWSSAGTTALACRIPSSRPPRPRPKSAAWPARRS